MKAPAVMCALWTVLPACIGATLTPDREAQIHAANDALLNQGAVDRVPAGRLLVWRSMIVTGYEDGLIAEEWSVSDFRERLRTQ